MQRSPDFPWPSHSGGDLSGQVRDTVFPASPGSFLGLPFSGMCSENLLKEGLRSYQIPNPLIWLLLMQRITVLPSGYSWSWSMARTETTLLLLNQTDPWEPQKRSQYVGRGVWEPCSCNTPSGSLSSRGGPWCPRPAVEACQSRQPDNILSFKELSVDLVLLVYILEATTHFNTFFSCANGVFPSIFYKQSYFSPTKEQDSALSKTIKNKKIFLFYVTFPSFVCKMLHRILSILLHGCRVH